MSQILTKALERSLGKRGVRHSDQRLAGNMLKIARIGLLAICALIAACGPTAAQIESARTVAAFAVPLPSESDRAEFLSVLRAAAEADGMHVDADTSEELDSRSKAMPQAAMTLHAGVWRGSNDDESVASAMDWPDHVGEVWVMFSKGRDPALTSRFRDSAMRAIMAHWPDTLSLPLMPTGAIPNYRDLIRTPAGYVVNPSAAHKYQLAGAAKQ